MAKKKKGNNKKNKANKSKASECENIRAEETVVEPSSAVDIEYADEKVKVDSDESGPVHADCPPANIMRTDEQATINGSDKEWRSINETEDVSIDAVASRDNSNEEPLVVIDANNSQTSYAQRTDDQITDNIAENSSSNQQTMADSAQEADCKNVNETIAVAGENDVSDGSEHIGTRMILETNNDEENNNGIDLSGEEEPTKLLEQDTNGASEERDEHVNMNMRENSLGRKNDDDDDTLSDHEKFIKEDCQKWDANEESMTLTVNEESTMLVNEEYIDRNTTPTVATYINDVDDNESIGDNSTRRQSSIELDEVNLIEDEAFSTSGNRSNPVTHATNDAFGFLVTALRNKLGDDARNVSDSTLRQYLCWKPDVNRAVERFREHHKFLKENFTEKTLLLSVNPKVCYLLRNGMALAPEELIDKNGSAVMVIRAVNCDLSSNHNCSETDVSRAIFFTIQQMLERKSLDTLIRGIVLVLDLAGCVRKNIPSTVIKTLGNAAGCFPVRIKAMYVVSMPWWFPSGKKKLLSAKLRERIHFLKDKAALAQYIDEDRLLEEDGGIYNFDLQSWISTTLSAEVGIKTTIS